MLPAVAIRPLLPDDARAARRIVEAQVAGTPYAELPRWALDAALDGQTDEARAMAAHADGELIGLALYGLVAGTQGAGRLILIAVSASAQLRGVGSQLADAAVADLGRLGARFVGVEFPDDINLGPGYGLLHRAGFAEESRVKDFYRDGVDLVFLRREIGRS